MGLLKFEDLQVGQELAPLENPPIERVQLVKYAGSSGDFNPLHTVDAFAKGAGLNGVIAHGMLSMGFIGKYVRSLVGDTADIKQVGVRFGKMAMPEDVLTCKGKVTAVEETDEGRVVTMEVAAVNQNGDVITSGTSQVKFF